MYRPTRGIMKYRNETVLVLLATSPQDFGTNFRYKFDKLRVYRVLRKSSKRTKSKNLINVNLSCKLHIVVLSYHGYFVNWIMHISIDWCNAIRCSRWISAIMMMSDKTKRQHLFWQNRLHGYLFKWHRIENVANLQ